MEAISQLPEGNSRSLLTATLIAPCNRVMCTCCCEISPDSRWLIYTQLDQFGSDIMLMENFR